MAQDGSCAYTCLVFVAHTLDSLNALVLLLLLTLVHERFSNGTERSRTSPTFVE